MVLILLIGSPCARSVFRILWCIAAQPIDAPLICVDYLWAGYVPPLTHLSNPGRHNADAVERRTIDQLRAYDGVDQHVLLRIDRTMDLERFEEQ